jgi:putative endonuclease
MEPGTGRYYVYITTNENKELYETGVTAALSVRLRSLENKRNAAHVLDSHADCLYLLYWERHTSIEIALERVAQIKKLSKIKKAQLIETVNPGHKFLNQEIDETN